MKRILFFILMVVFMSGAFCVQAKKPWAEMAESVEVRQGQSSQRQVYRQGKGEKSTPKQEAVSNSPKRVTVLPLILQGKPIKVSIFPPSPLSNKEKYASAQKMIRQAYADWFKNALDYIELEKRQQEFSDVLPILKRGVPIEFVSFGAGPKGGPQPEDIWVSIDDTLAGTQQSCSCSNCLGCAISGDANNAISVFVSADSAYRTLVHELGHTLGFADAYEEGYVQNASKTHRSGQRIPFSVMNSENIELSPDDADGLINMIDSWTIYSLQNKYPKDWCAHLSPRVRNGWNGLLRYKTGTSIERYAMGTSVSLLPKNRTCAPGQAQADQAQPAAAKGSTPGKQRPAGRAQPQANKNKRPVR